MPISIKHTLMCYNTNKHDTKNNLSYIKALGNLNNNGCNKCMKTCLK